MDAIVLRNVSKEFRRNAVRREYTTLKSELVKFLKGRRTPPAAPAGVTHALSDVSLSIPRGRTVGLVGRNGSGKSTLLKLVTGIYRPTSGTVEVNGRISALLELGAGFHPDFTGRENITVNGIILGMSRREIRERMEEIIAFAELSDFIDQPVRTYSSGMYARLAFSVATHVDPDLLIVDEILSVGDEHFSRKSTAKMSEFRRAGKTILLVSHELGSLEARCDEAVWLDSGVLRAYGDPAYVVSEYRRAVAESEVQAEIAVGHPAPSPVHLTGRQPRTGPAAETGRRWGTFEAEIIAVHVRTPGGAEHAVFEPDEGVEISLEIVADVSLVEPSVEVSLFAPDGTLLWRGSAPIASATSAEATLTFDRIGLSDGNYRIDVAVLADNGRVCCDFHKGLHGFAVRSPDGSVGVVRPLHRWRVNPAPAQGT